MRKEQSWEPLEELVPADIFKAEVRVWARIGVVPTEIHLRPMRRKWGPPYPTARNRFPTSTLIITAPPIRMRGRAGSRW